MNTKHKAVRKLAQAYSPAYSNISGLLGFLHNRTLVTYLMTRRDYCKLIILSRVVMTIDRIANQIYYALGERNHK
jgi:hypothetical protein